ncbi:MAG TPA: hypothetical protein VGO64_10055, partial [Candidatus Limnocylindrales bacterium]|nr:hypothetical protein [Candidatus Limnocylindrales bacterium]
ASRPGLTPAEVREALQYLGNLTWKTSTDPDSTHEKLLDVSRIGARGDFSVKAGGTVTLGRPGGSARFTVTLSRGTTSFERVRFSASGLPAGAKASFDPASRYGFGSGSTTLTVTVPSGLSAGSYPITITGDEHGNHHAASATIVIETDVPVAHAPVVAPVANAVLGTSTAPIRISWAAAHDPSTGIGGYETGTSVDGAAYGSATAVGGSVRSRTTKETIGHTYQHRLRAKDSHGNWSPWVVGDRIGVSVVGERSAAVAYSGRWSRYVYSGAYGGTTAYATAAGTKARLRFTGRAVALVAPTGPTRGSAAIWIDGVKKATVSFKTSSGHSRVLKFVTTFASVGTHSIEVRPSGTGRVDLDTFVILR